MHHDVAGVTFAFGLLARDIFNVRTVLLSRKVYATKISRRQRSVFIFAFAL